MKFLTPLFFQAIPYFVHKVSLGLRKLFAKTIKCIFWDIIAFKNDKNVTLQLPKDTRYMCNLF